ncbi:energy transducer TonB [Polaribacter sp. R2A056_3_33]|uniref:energy transducer TonB n=1 Tax=Polaribacter sp. R2A056_3_33 TaxID=2745563 RepID=UPI001C4E35A3|nr:energy transducer TonB [Polaribacter sp. R2A056_3_33]QXP70185.1 energy transducer TonB [Polaribacter sp. R2A056_3_33]
MKKLNLLFFLSLFSISLFSQSEVKIDKKYFENGNIKSEINFLRKGNKKIREGKSTFWYSTGKLKIITNYIKNKLNGERISYWKNGELKRKELFKKGKLKSGKCFDKSGKEIEYYNFEIQPEFPGGKIAFKSFIKKHLTSNSSNTRGKLIFKFTIESNGKTSNVKILKDTYPSLKNEVNNMFNFMPIWKPAKQDGNPVKVKRTIPINFR